MKSLVSGPGVLLIVSGFLAASVRVATPLLFAALGETIAERGGVINLGIEGAMLSGALAAALGSRAGGPWVGVLAASLAGLLIGILMAIISVWLGADQVITGTALTLGAIGLTGAVYRVAYGAAGAGLSVPTFHSVPIPLLSQIPIIGPALFQQPALVYLGILSVPAFWVILFRTRWGLALRASGESVSAARAAGVRVLWVRTGGVMLASALAGIGGSTLVLAQVGTFAERMTAGRGFLALAIVVLGRWNPVWVAMAALLIGLLTALQFLFQALGLSVPYQLFLMMPYLATLLALGIVRGRTPAPLSIGKF
ncbi:MAG: ABC transporter permease [Gemmatimonadota bacterium]